jgi:hypothetical protein
MHMSEDPENLYYWGLPPEDCVRRLQHAVVDYEIVLGE